MDNEHKIRTLAHQLVEILAVYGASLDQWRLAPSDVALYERTHANLDLVRVLAGKAFPGRRAEVAELLCAHSELKLQVLRRYMGRRSHGPCDETPESDLQLHMLVERQEDAVAALRSLCLQRCGPDSEGDAWSAGRGHLAGAALHG
jgi:hypothetical protein